MGPWTLEDQINYDFAGDIGKLPWRIEAVRQGRDRTIRRMYNDPTMHGSYCPCPRCEDSYGTPLPQWIHDIGRLGFPDDYGAAGKQS